MYCKNCGSELPNDSIYCPNCGTNQSSSSSEKPKNIPSKISPWVGIVLMALAYFIAFYVVFLIALFSGQEYLTLAVVAVGCSIATYFENRKRNK